MRQTETITRNIQININICRNHSSGSLPVSSQRSATLGVGKSGMGLSSWLRPWNVGKPLTLWIFHIPLIHWVLCRFLLLKHPSLKKNIWRIQNCISRFWYTSHVTGGSKIGGLPWWRVLWCVHAPPSWQRPRHTTGGWKTTAAADYFPLFPRSESSGGMVIHQISNTQKNWWLDILKNSNHHQSPSIIASITQQQITKTTKKNIKKPWLWGWLVVSTPLKSISQLGWDIPNIWKVIRHVPNHHDFGVSNLAKLGGALGTGASTGTAASATVPTWLRFSQRDTTPVVEANWRTGQSTFIFFRGVGQPPTSFYWTPPFIMGFSIAMLNNQMVWFLLTQYPLVN